MSTGAAPSTRIALRDAAFDDVLRCAVAPQVVAPCGGHRRQQRALRRGRREHGEPPRPRVVGRGCGARRADRLGQRLARHRRPRRRTGSCDGRGAIAAATRGTDPRRRARTNAEASTSAAPARSTPRTMAAGTRAAFAITRPLAAATSSASATIVGVEGPSEMVRAAAQVDRGGKPGTADRHVDEPGAPCAPEGVRDHDADVDAEGRGPRGPQRTGGSVRVLAAGAPASPPPRSTHRRRRSRRRSRAPSPRSPGRRGAPPRAGSPPRPRARGRSPGTSRPSAFETIFDVTATTSPVRSPAAVSEGASRAARSSSGSGPREARRAR